MFLHLSVILFGGVCVPACTWADSPGHTPPRTDTPNTFGQTHPLGRHPQAPPQPHSRRLLQRTVRILLECILVWRSIFNTDRFPVHLEGKYMGWRSVLVFPISRFVTFFLPPANEGTVMFSGLRCLSVNGGGGDRCMMSIPLWQPGPMSLLGGLCPCSHVPAGGGGFVQRGSLSGRPPYGEERTVCVLLDCFLV